MTPLRPCLRPLLRIRYTLPRCEPQATSSMNQRGRESSGTSLNNPEQQQTTAIPIAQSSSSSSSYVIKPSSNATEVITLHDRVKIIPLEQGIVHVQLSRPDKLNSLDMPMFEAVANAAHRLKHDTNLRKTLRVVIISGEGRAFCTGLDAKNVVLSSCPSASMKKLLERPSAFGGETGLGNLAQDVSYLWR